VQEGPDPVLLVERDLDDVVARTERTEVLPPPTGPVVGLEPGADGDRG
jgi:hypothetical protein